MRKTQRRKLYGKSRHRQRGGVKCRLLVVGAALVALQGAHADEPSLGAYLSNYIEKGDWSSSKALGEKLASYIPTPEDAFGLAGNTFGSWQSYFDKSSESSGSCATPPGPPITIDEAEKVVEPYLLRVGERYTFTPKDKPEEAQDVYVLDHTTAGKWTTDPPISPEDWDKYTVKGPLPKQDPDGEGYYDGGRRRVSRVSRKSRRKTLRRK